MREKLAIISAAVAASGALEQEAAMAAAPERQPALTDVFNHDLHAPAVQADMDSMVVGRVEMGDGESFAFRLPGVTTTSRDGRDNDCDDSCEGGNDDDNDDNDDDNGGDSIKVEIELDAESKSESEASSGSSGNNTTTPTAGRVNTGTCLDFAYAGMADLKRVAVNPLKNRKGQDVIGKYVISNVDQPAMREDCNSSTRSAAVSIQARLRSGGWINYSLGRGAVFSGNHRIQGDRAVVRTRKPSTNYVQWRTKHCISYGGQTPPCQYTYRLG